MAENEAQRAAEAEIEALRGSESTQRASGGDTKPVKVARRPGIRRIGRERIRTPPGRTCRGVEIVTRKAGCHGWLIVPEAAAVAIRSDAEEPR